MNAIKSVVFLSAYYNHHLKPFSDAMHHILDGQYVFIETEAMPQERIDMGWNLDVLPPYVISREEFQKNREKYQQLIDSADAVITGVAPKALIQNRFASGKVTFRYSERPLKKGIEIWRYPDRFIRWHRWNPRKGNIHMLCASAYTAGDYAKMLLFRGRCYKWGYFTQLRKYTDPDEMIQNKTQASLVWVARFIDWKHPEIALEIAKRLKRDGYSFSLKMIGNGALLETVEKIVREEGLEEYVQLLGAMTPDQVRDHMEKAQIHLFTSDQQEGWGAVLNEAMNSGCVSISDRRIGAAPYLISDGKNGFLYSGVEDLYQKVTHLLDHPDQREAMAKAAYQTILEEWNAETAARRFLDLAGQLKNNPAVLSLPQDGVCSRAEEL